MSRDKTIPYENATSTFGYIKCRDKAILAGRLPNRIDVKTGIHICYNPRCKSLLYIKSYRCTFCNCAFYCSEECSKYSNFRTCLFCFIADMGKQYI